MLALLMSDLVFHPLIASLLALMAWKLHQLIKLVTILQED